MRDALCRGRLQVAAIVCGAVTKSGSHGNSSFSSRLAGLKESPGHGRDAATESGFQDVTANWPSLHVARYACQAHRIALKCLQSLASTNTQTLTSLLYFCLTLFCNKNKAKIVNVNKFHPRNASNLSSIFTTTTKKHSCCLHIVMTY